MSRFDQQLDKPYAVCSNCDTELASSEETSAHLTATFADGKSHSAQILNQTRPQRIAQELGFLADEVLTEFVDKAYELVDREGVTEDEITEAVNSIVADFSDAWANRDA